MMHVNGDIYCDRSDVEDMIETLLDIKTRVNRDDARGIDEAVATLSEIIDCEN